MKETIARGVSEGLLAYVGKKGHGRYEPIVFKKAMQSSDVEISDDVLIVTAEEAAKHVEPQKLTSVILFPDQITLQPGARIQFRADGRDQQGRSMALPAAIRTADGGTVETRPAGHGEKRGVAAEGRQPWAAKIVVWRAGGGRHYALAHPTPAARASRHVHRHDSSSPSPSSHRATWNVSGLLCRTARISTVPLTR